MALNYSLPRSLHVAPTRDNRAGWCRRFLGVALILYLAPVILLVLGIGTVGMAFGNGRRLPRARG